VNGRNEEEIKEKYIDGNDKITVYSTGIAEPEKVIRRKQ
jgi:hypothetical protein